MGEGDTREVLHDDVEVVVGLNDVVDLDDVGVILEKKSCKYFN